MDKIFSEYFARKENFLTRVDPRIKIIFCFAGIILTLTSAAFYLPLILIVLCVSCLFIIRVPFKVIILRMAQSLGIAITILFIKTFFYHDKLDSSLLIMSKIIGSTSIMLFLSLTSTLDKLLAASCWFKVPKTWIEICLIAYRYIFVLLEDASTIIDAQKVRLGYSGLTASFRSIGTLAGTIIIRAYDQSVATYEAMVLRGYKGSSHTLLLENKLKLKDLISICIFSAMLVLLFALKIVFRI